MEINNKQTILGPDFSYSDALNHLTYEHSKKLQAEGKDISKFPLRPSAAGHCERELAYALMEYRGLAKYEKEVHEPELTRLFALGHSVEYVLLRDMAQHFREIGFTIEYKQQRLSFMHLESKIKPSWSQWIEGSIDFVLWSEKHKAIGDVKSKKEKYSSYRKSDWEETNYKYSQLKSLVKIGDTAFYADDAVEFLNEVDDPYLAANVLQLNLYAMNGFIAERGIDHCFLIYYNKNTSQLRELRFRPSEQLSDYVKNKFKNAFEAVEAGQPELAKQEFGIGQMKCAFCTYKEVCRPADDPLREWFKTFPKKVWPKDTNRIDDVDLAETLEEIYSEYKVAASASTSTEKLASELCKLLTDARINKVKFSDGEVYEVKLLKSPKERLELRRSKT